MKRFSILYLFVAARLLSAQDYWTPTGNLSNATSPDVAVAPDNTAASAFISSSTGYGGAVLSAGSKVWIPTSSPVSSPVTAANRPQIGVDALGNFIGAFLVGAGNSLEVATLPAGSLIWQNITNLGLSGPDYSLDVNQAGQAVIVWRLGANTIRGAVLSSPLSTWITTTNLNLPSPNNLSPAVCIDPTGNAFAVWRNNVTAFASRLPAGSTTWSPPVAILTPITPAYPRIACDPSGNAIALFSQTSSARAVRYNPNTNTWTPFSNSLPFAMSASTTVPSSNIEMDASGNAVLVYRNSASTAIIGGYITAGSLTVTPTSIPSTAGASSLGVPTLGLDGSGNAIIAWSENLSGVTYIRSSTLQKGSLVWTALNDPYTPPPTVGSLTVNLDVNTQGYAVLAGTVSALTPPSSAGAVHFLVFPPINLSGKQVKNKFLTQTDYVNCLSWEPNLASATLASYKIYRDSGLTDLAGIVPATQTHFKDHNRTKNTTYTYYIVAVDANGNASSPAVVVVHPN